MNKASFSIRVRRLLLGLVAMVVFSNVLLPALTRSCDKLEYMATVLDERDIDPSRYYYTDIEAVSEANQNISDTLRFTPTGPARSTGQETGQ